MTSAPETNLLASFYRYLVTLEEFRSAEERTKLERRLGDVLLKMMTVVGGPRVLSVLMELVAAEKEGGSVLEAKEEKTATLEEVQMRGVSALKGIYGPSLLPRVYDGFGGHRDQFRYMMEVVVYGCCLGDFEELSPLETESVMFAGITCTGLRRPGLWHMRGLGRMLGARGENEEDEGVRTVKDVLRSVKVVVMSVVEFVGPEMVRRSGLDSELGWVNVGDVKRELGGWGED